MNLNTKWEFHKQDKERIIWINICTEDLTGIAISINKWWKTKYPNFKIRIVNKIEFERIKKINEGNDISI